MLIKERNPKSKTERQSGQWDCFINRSNFLHDSFLTWFHLKASLDKT